MPTQVDEESLSWMGVNQEETSKQQSVVSVDNEQDEETIEKMDAAVKDDNNENKMENGGNGTISSLSNFIATQNTNSLQMPTGTTFHSAHSPNSSTSQMPAGTNYNAPQMSNSLQMPTGTTVNSSQIPTGMAFNAYQTPNVSQIPTGTTSANTAPIPSVNQPASAATGTPGLFATANVIAKLTGGRNPKVNSAATSNPTPNEKYPQDCYSFIALHGPRKNFPFFLFGLLPFVFQMMFLLLLIWSETDELRGTIGETDNPDSGNPGFMASLASFIPANASPIIRMTQTTAVAAYVIFPDSSIQDIVRSVQTFPLPSRVNRGDHVGKMRLACFLRATQGALAMFVTLLLVMTSDAVVDIILNFTAVNFISNLDDYAFALALAGEFGPTLQLESETIANKDLPACMKRKKTAKHWYNVVISSLICVVLFGMMTFVFLSQNSSKVWVTRTFRVQFQENTGLNEYSGCFGINDNPNSISFARRSYDSFGDGGNVSFAYCRQHRQWILLDSREMSSDPCVVRDENVELSRSSKTDAFDIGTSFAEQWVSSTNTPLDMYFFESGEENDLFCNLTLGDGVCDNQLNKMGFGYDEGDCCSATCQGANCGRKTEIVFGKSSSSFSDFPNCTNPAMVPITIRIDGVKSNRDEEFAPSSVLAALPYYEWPFNPNDPTEEFQWRNATPVNPYLVLDCDERQVLFTYIEKSMVDQNHTVKVADGANCTLEVRNTTSNESIADDAPIWFVNYTLFHGDQEETEQNNSVEILSGQSSHQERVGFKRIPECYFADLEDYDYVDTPYIYTALDWLAVLEDTFDKDTSQCGERFALFNMAFAMNGTGIITKTQNQCRWPEIVCSDEQVTHIDWSYKYLNGDIPNELVLLKNLEVMKMSELM